MVAVEPVAEVPAGLAGRYLRTLAATVAAIAAAVLAVNLAAFALMTRPENAAIVQLLDGWSRLYKPILYDVAAPEVVIFGASYARDAFDPETVSAIVGRSTFNFAVSGGQAYENRRFAQSAAGNANLGAVVVPVDSFVVRPGAPRVSHGFDESVLNVTAEGKANPTVAVSRAAAVALSGAAVGNNIQFLGTLARRAAGAGKEDLLPSYQRRDNSTHAAILAGHRSRVFPGEPPARPAFPALGASGETGLPEFERVVALFCESDVDVFAYFTPASGGVCSQPVALRVAVFSFLREMNGRCRARFYLHDFQYPNAVTLEGVASVVPLSQYFRPDGHPRPTVGDLIAARMFGSPFPDDAPEAVRADFGVDLLSLPDPSGWWQRRLARCDGFWEADDAAVVTGGVIVR